MGVMIHVRTTNQIQIAVQECDPDITDEELRHCIEAMRTIKHFYKQSLMNLISAIRDGKPEGLLKMKAEIEWGTLERMFAAEKKPPSEWLGPDHIPGSPEQRKSLAWAKRVFEKATGEKID